LPYFGEHLPCRVGVLVDQPGRRLGAHADRGQRGAQAIVQVPPEASPLIFARKHESLPRTSQGVVECEVVDRRAHLAREIVDEATVGRRERLTRLACAQPQAPYQHRMRHQLDLHLVGLVARRSSPLGGGVRIIWPAHLQRHVREP